jgi:hypothetical protein
VKKLHFSLFPLSPCLLSYFLPCCLSYFRIFTFLTSFCHFSSFFLPTLTFLLHSFCSLLSFFLTAFLIFLLLLCFLPSFLPSFCHTLLYFFAYFLPSYPSYFPTSFLLFFLSAPFLPTLFLSVQISHSPLLQTTGSCQLWIFVPHWQFQGHTASSRHSITCWFLLT